MKPLRTARRLALAALAALLLPLGAFAQDGEVRTVTVEGFAGAQDNMRARDEAIEDAYRRAVEEAAGVFITAESKAENSALIYDRILSQAAGYVRSREILSEGEENGLYKVAVRCDVTLAPLQTDLMAIGLLMERLDMPRVLVLGDERVDGQAGYDRTVAIEIEDLLASKGFRLVAGDFFEAEKQRNAALAEKLYNDYDEAIAMANRYSAEVVVIYTAEADYGGSQERPMFLERYAASARVRILSPDVAIQSASLSDNARGSAEVRNRAARKSLEELGKKLAPQVMERILNDFVNRVGDGAGPGNYLELVVSDAKYSDGSKLKRELEQARGVKSVGQVEFLGGVATIRLEGTLTSGSLAEWIEENMTSLEIEEVSGSRVKARKARERGER